MAKAKEFTQLTPAGQLRAIKNLAALRPSKEIGVKMPSYGEIEAVAYGIGKLNNAELAEIFIEELAKVALKQGFYIKQPVHNLEQARFHAKCDIWEIVGECCQGWPSKEFCKSFNISEQDIQEFCELGRKLKQEALGNALVSRWTDLVLEDRATIEVPIR